MYGVGDMIVYNEDGVCRVEAVGPLKLTGAGDAAYYTLRPLSGEGRTYVPVDTALPLRPMMNADEAEALLREMPRMRAEVSRVNNKRLLEAHYRALMQPHTPQALVMTLRSVYDKRGANPPKPLSATDERYRKRAEAMLSQELAAALDIPQEAAEMRIREAMEVGA